MFATGLPSLALSLFSSVSIIIAVPSAVADLGLDRDDLARPPGHHHSLSVLPSMIVLFVIGGVSGYYDRVCREFDWQMTDTYFVVAHIHYVLIGINVFPVAGALYYSFPKMTGRMLDERIGKWNFWTMFVGMNFVAADASDRSVRHAAAYLHLSRRNGVEFVEHPHQHRRLRLCVRGPAVGDQHSQKASAVDGSPAPTRWMQRPSNGRCHRRPPYN